MKKNRIRKIEYEKIEYEKKIEKTEEIIFLARKLT